MALHLHRATRADRLAAGLASLLSAPLADPFATEIVVVPTPGVERWLSQALSHRLGAAPDREDGVCAGVEFCSPRRLVARAIGTDPDDDPWAVHRAVWSLLTVIDGARGEAWAAPVWSYLTRGGHDPAVPEGGRRFGLARHLAELFARYAVARPAMIADWQQGRDVDGSGRPLGRDRAWQAEAWRRLRAAVGVPGPAERLAVGRDHLRDHPDGAALPERLSVFGPTRLDPDQLDTLAVLAEHRDVHLWLTHPSPALWERLAAEPARERGPRRDDPGTGAARHRLLRYLGRDVVELQEQLAAHAAVDELLPVEITDDSLLHRLQADLAADVALPMTRPHAYDPADRSVSLHACHGPDRQVEVLREVLLGLLADDETLQPRDVIVMCPDIEAFAPLISATFGLDGEDRDDQAGHPGHRLRVRLADRSLRQLNPLLALVSRLLQLAEARVTAAELLDLFATPVVARRFGFSEDDVASLAELVPAAGVRWGLDAEHRTRYGMAGFGQNTWAAGLDRLLLGVTMSEQGEHFLGTALPLDGIDSGDVDRVGRLAEAVDRTAAVLRRCTGTQTLEQWSAVLRGAVDDLGAVGPRDAWQLGHAYGALGSLLDAAGEGDTLLSTAEVRALLDDTLRGRPGRANFRTGTLTMATLAPMRSVPHRVVCLLGIDDGTFPRVDRVDGDDLLADDPWVGDRDRRSEDRQLFLDAVTAATEKLLLIYSGADPRTGRERPPAVPVKELLDTLDLTAVAADGRPVSAHVIQQHPLQPFDARNFTGPFSFDAQGLGGARALTGERRPVEVAPLRLPPGEPVTAVTLRQLTDFFAHPARALLRSRTGLSTYGDDDPPGEQIPVALDGLQTWAIGDRVLRRRLAGAELDGLAGAEWRRGEVPPQRLGARVVDRVLGQVAELDDGSAALRQGDPVTLDLEARVGGVTVTGTTGSVYDDTWVSVGYSFVGAKQRLTGWLGLLTLTVTDPSRPWRVITVGRGGRSCLGPVPAEFAVQVLDDLLQLYALGQDELLPLPVGTAAEYARLRRRDWPFDQVRPAVHKAWERDDDPSWRLLLPSPDLDGVLTAPARDEERRGSIAEPSRFGSLALRVWLPLLGSEQT